MIGALLATVLFSISGISASRMTRIWGGVRANLFRILLATLLLGLMAHTFGKGLRGPALGMLLISGCLGFGVGDTALYQALPRIGTRLGILLVHCTAAPFAAFIEWLWLGTVLAPGQIASSAVILCGVALALAPDKSFKVSPEQLKTGITWGVVAGLAQGAGALLSRRATTAARLEGFEIDGISAAYQRIWGGVMVAIITYLVVRFRTGFPSPPPGESQWKRGWPFLVTNAIAGPTLGVSAYQWGLASAPTGVVLPLVALTPLIIIPFAIRYEGERPTLRSLIGGILAVIGVIGLTRFKP